MENLIKEIYDDYVDAAAEMGDLEDYMPSEAYMPVIRLLYDTFIDGYRGIKR